jgi:alpha-L-rhamnosidase
VLLKYLIEDAERSDLLAAPLAKITKPGYGYFLSRGETTWPEHWESDVESRILTCYTGIASFFIKSIAGIRPDPAHPGYRDFVIKPALVGGLSHAEAAIESVYGQIECRWQREGGTVRMRVVIPVNSQSTVYVPTSDAGSITEGGNPLRAAEGVAFVRSEAGYAVLQVQSGRYDFTARMAQP